MALRDKPVVGVIVAVIILAVSALLITRTTGGETIEGYYYNLETGDLITAPRDATADAAGGPRAYVFTCSSCDTDRQVVYIEKLTPEAQRMQATYRPSPDPAKEAEYRSVMEAGHQVAPPPAAGAQPNWQPYFSPEGQALVNTSRTLCAGSAAQACMP